MDEPPLDQGTAYVNKLVRRLKDLGCEPPSYSVGVCFPGTYLDRQPSQDNVNGIVIGKAELPYLAAALPPVMERALPPARAARGHWIDALHRLWGETWVPSSASASAERAQSGA